MRRFRKKVRRFVRLYWFWVSLGLVLTKVSVEAAYIERGYKAYGGEWLVLPVVMIVGYFVNEARMYLPDFIEEWREEKAYEATVALKLLTGTDADTSGIDSYYGSMKKLSEFLDKSKLDAETITTAKFIIDGLFKTFETDVSRFSDDEIEKMYYTKIDPMMNCGVDPKLLTGEKMLRKGVDIGTQPSQDIGIIHPYKIDNCAKIVFSIEGYGRYTDDIRAISESKERLENLLVAIKKLADEIGLILNMRKTRIARIDKPFRILQIQYWLTDTGRVVKKINPKSVTRERKKLKAYKRQLDLGKIDFATVENSFKSWIASNYKIMSRLQIDNMFKLYYSLFGRRITWKKKHSRLRWLMEQALKDLKELGEKHNKLERRMDKDDADGCRTRILRFADELRRDVKHSEEFFNQILDDISDYERYCTEHPEYKNSKAVNAIAEIDKVYQKCMEKNSFL